MNNQEKLTLVAFLEVAESDVAGFQEYESKVLKLLRTHRGTLERRLRNSDGTKEIHILSFANARYFQDFSSDPSRQELMKSIEGIKINTQITEVFDVDLLALGD